MTENVDVVVAGGGVMGASVAFWLTRLHPGLRVMVVEKDPTHARAATALSVASIRQQFSNPVNVEISRFGVSFIRAFQENIGHDVGIPSLGLVENGYLFLTGSQAGAEVMRDNVAVQRGLGASTELLTPDAIIARFPWLAVGDVVLGSFGPQGEGWFDNMGLLAGFRTAARAQGARFVTGCVNGALRDGVRVCGVQLANGATIQAGSVVCAMGTRAAEFLAIMGEVWPVEPRKRTVFVIDAPNARHPEAPLLVDHTGFYLRPEHGHWITAIVPTDDVAVDPDDFDAHHGDFDEVIWPLLYARAPGFDAVKVVRHWVGHYDYNTLDQNAILGPHPRHPGLFMMSGFSGHGLQQAPAVGRGLAEVILTGAYSSLDLNDLGVARVLANRPFLERAVV